MVHFPDHVLEMFVVIHEIWQEQGPEPACQIAHAVLELQKYCSLSFSGYF